MARTQNGGVMVSVGLLNFPVDMTTAVRSRATKGVALSNACAEGHPPAKINSVYRCPDCGNEDKSKLVKAVVNKDKSLTIVDPETLAATKKQAAPDALKNTLKLAVHPADQVDEAAVPAGTPAYQLRPAEESGFYDLLATLVADRPDLAFVGVWMTREKPQLYRLQSNGKHLRIDPCAWPEDVEARPAASVPSSPEHRAMFSELLDSLVTEFDPSAYTDDRSRALAEVIANGTTVAGAAGGTVTSMPNVDPLMAALEAARKAVAA